MAKGEGKVIAQNKKAGFDYFIEETIEAGIVLGDYFAFSFGHVVSPQLDSKKWPGATFSFFLVAPFFGCVFVELFLFVFRFAGWSAAFRLFAVASWFSTAIFFRGADHFRLLSS